MVTAWEYSLGDIFLSMLWFTLFIIWIWLLIAVFTDLFRSRDIGGWSKALWAIFIIVLPYLGVFVYLIARGHKMGEHAMADAQAQEAATRQYIQSVAGSGGGTSTAAEIAHLAELRDAGTLSEEEFQTAKAKLLA
ncbi:MAG TPA: SHOCT domain-containing protein [Nocardioides sp.]|uniref:SHOCT domain-containing protein n=1 Tax=uncultured Nocardioides sp. TaxID=198441 RepID=UPI0026174A1A|nr:SHOCT domain-containing protein [uncultured Nocardioides sp.]HRD61471.1 SHOCT domain-containing protein [Nocardioides sp.]HRI98166.1 SHOCT domain-containing protein [Nocardioides sp.]HRK47872.1 SHOCT domain-containing protein [Nocardioides sp.]